MGGRWGRRERVVLPAVSCELYAAIEGLRSLSLGIRTIQILFPPWREGHIASADTFKERSLALPSSYLHCVPDLVCACVEPLHVAVFKFALCSPPINGILSARSIKLRLTIWVE